MLYLNDYIYNTRFAYEKRYFNVNNFIYNKLSYRKSMHWCNIDKYMHTEIDARCNVF